MVHSMPRVIVGVALVIAPIVMPGAGVAAAAFGLPAQTDEVAPVVGTTDFLIEAFPHDTADVHFSDTWGAPRSGGRRHRGTDVKSPKGSAVVAVAAGTIVHMDWNHLSGWNIRIEHAGGWTTSYLHLNNDSPGTDDGEGGRQTAFAASLEVGDAVAGGQLIGYVGDSGNAEGTVSHTHFELADNGRKRNPYPYLAAAWQRRLRYFAAVGAAG